jgi:hypothetical protein
MEDLPARQQAVCRKGAAQQAEAAAWLEKASP